MFDPAVLDAVDRATFDFCQATLDTLATDLGHLRQQLQVGLEGGETYRELTNRVAGVFSDRARADRIARTEATRAMHQGEVWSMGETGIVEGKTWLASADACDLCLSLNGKTVGLDEPFLVMPGGGPYAAIMHPPGHPFCMCSQTYSLDEAAIGVNTLEQRRITPAFGRYVKPARSGFALAASFVPPWRK